MFDYIGNKIQGADIMFDHIGNKIQGAAKVLFWLFAIVSIILGGLIVYNGDADQLPIAIVVIAVGIFVSLVFSWIYVRIWRNYCFASKKS